MAMDIVQPFLNNAEQRHLHMLLQSTLLAVDLEIRLENLAFLQLADQLPESRYQSQVIQGHRPHVKDNLPHISQAGANLPPQLLQACLRLLRPGIHQPLTDRCLINQVGHLLSRAIVNFTGHPQPLVLLSLDDLYPQELVLGGNIHLCHHIADLRSQIANNRPQLGGQPLRHQQCLLHAPQPYFQAVTLAAGLEFLFLHQGQAHLHILDRLIAGTNLILGIVGKIAADLHQPLLLLLLAVNQHIHLVLQLGGLLLQLLQHNSCRLYIIFCILIDFKYLPLAIFHSLHSILKCLPQQPFPLLLHIHIARKLHPLSPIFPKQLNYLSFYST